MLKLLSLLFLVPTILYCQAWPNHPAQQLDLLQAADKAQGTLASSINSSTTTLTLTNGSNFVPFQVLFVDNEQIKLCGIAGVTLTVCAGGRGFNGTSATSHSLGVTVAGYSGAVYHNTLANETIAVEGWLNTQFTNILNVMVYGATGNGSTDDTNSINLAIAALGGNCGSIYFPPGNYKVTSSLNISSGCITLLLAGNILPQNSMSWSSKISWYFQGGQLQPVFGANQNLNDPNIVDSGVQAFGGLGTITHIGSKPLNIRLFGADPTGTLDTRANIQTAINAASSGGEIYIPTGNYLVCSGLPLVVSKPIKIRGSSWGSAIEPCSSLNNTTDIISFKPLTPGNDIQGLFLEDFAITPQSGTPGRYGIVFDGTNASFGYVFIKGLGIDTLGSYGMATINAQNNVNGTPYVTDINDSYFDGGIKLDYAGDSVAIRNSTITGPNDLYINLVNSTTGDQALGLHIENNNITSASGVTVLNAEHGTFSGNDVETDFTFTGTNGFINLAGNTGTGLNEFQIFDNTLGCSNLLVTNCIYIDHAKNTQIYHNKISQPVKSVVITANASNTHLTFNTTVPSSNPISSWLTDNGTNTIVEYTDPNGIYQIALGSGMGYQTTSGVTGIAITPSQFRINPTNGTFCGSIGDPSTTGCNTFLYVESPGTFGLGTAIGTPNGILDVGAIKSNGQTGVTGNFNCTGGQHISGLVINGGSITSPPTCN